jgi:hypothetical protein
MLTENTGRHMLDSGGAYGRHWERNQGRSFEDEPDSSLDCRYGELNVTHNVFHWLADRLDYDEQATEWLREFGDSEDRREEPWLATMRDFPEYFANQKKLEQLQHEKCDTCEGHGTLGDDECDCDDCGGSGYYAEPNDYEVTGIYGDGEPVVVNTYNGEDLLSQTIQYVYFEVPELNEAYVVLQIHGGCDVRGGYTAPKVFVLDDGTHGELAIFDNAKATIYCTGEDCTDEYGQCNSWYTDDGCHFYPNGGGDTQLQDYQSVRLVESGEWDSALVQGGYLQGGGKVFQRNNYRDAYRFPGKNSPKSTGGFSPNVIASRDCIATEWAEGYFCWDEDGNGYCPHCGSKLAASSY